MTDTQRWARVQGVGSRHGATTDDIPDGYITWEEHYLAWEAYARQHRGQSAEQIEQRGGFGYRELQHFLGRNPKTWRLREPLRFAEFKFAETDDPSYDPEPEPTAEPTLSHVWYAGTEIKICDDRAHVPEAPIVWDAMEAEHCPACMSVMEGWLEWWTDYGKR